VVFFHSGERFPAGDLPGERNKFFASYKFSKKSLKRIVGFLMFYSVRAIDFCLLHFDTCTGTD
jgi:hypothetical protein